MEKKIRKALSERERDGLLRGLTSAVFLPGGKLRVGNRLFVNFSSNDYLGLASHPKIAEAAAMALKPVFGSGASRLMSGSSELHALLEEKAAAFKGKPAALVFNSGYQANVGVISALMGRDDAVFSDRLNHASIIDGIRLSGARFFRFRHNDAGHLAELLKEERKKYRHAMVVTETVFSMDGDIAPLKDIAALKNENDFVFMVDEAHATGIFGRKGSGLVEEFGITDDVDIIMGTFSKALGSFGAYVALGQDMKEYLVNTCRSFIYSTSLPPSVIAANMAAIDMVEKDPQRRKGLLRNAAYLREELASAGFTVKGASQIVPVIIGGNEAAVDLSDRLRAKGYWTTPVRPPTVPEGEARIRISLSYDHGKDVIGRFVEEMKREVSS